VIQTWLSGMVVPPVVFPVLAGVIRTSLLAFTVLIRVPRTCGGDRLTVHPWMSQGTCSPQTRG